VFAVIVTSLAGRCGELFTTEHAGMGYTLVDSPLVAGQSRAVVVALSATSVVANKTRFT